MVVEDFHPCDYGDTEACGVLAESFLEGNVYVEAMPRRQSEQSGPEGFISGDPGGPRP